MSDKLSSSLSSINSQNVTIKSRPQVDIEKRPERVSELEVEGLEGPGAREQWSSRVEFLLSCLGNAVGLGNIWRFPYLTYKNGGGAFVVAYLVMTVLIGLPMFLVELTIGQFSGFGPAHVYSNIAPLFKGVGYAIIATALLVNSYYIVILSWSLYYFFETFMGQKWKYCDNDFNTYKCKTVADAIKGNFVSRDYKSSAEEFFDNHIVMKSSDINDLSVMRTPLVVCLFLSWAIVGGSLIKGIKSSGKVVYFTATFPYVVLTLLMFRALFLDGAYEGIRYFVVPDWDKLLTLGVWRDAAIQVFYSFGIAGGGMLTYASYNKFNEPIVLNTVLIAAADIFTSLFAGVVVFAMLGFMAHTLEKPVSEVISGGFGLIFIAIPEGLSQMPGSIFWNALYFFMLFLLGIDSLFAAVEAVMTFIFDTMRSYNIVVFKPPIVVAVCVIMFFLGTPYCTPSGVYILELIDHYIGFPYLFCGLMEAVIISFAYGLKNFIADLKLMTNWRPSLWMRSQLIVRLSSTCPLFLTVLLIKETIDLISPNVPLGSGTYIFPGWTKVVGWAAALIPLLIIPAMMAHQLFFVNKELGLIERIKVGLMPTKCYFKNAKRNVDLEADDYENTKKTFK